MLIVMVLSSAVFGWWVHRSREWIRQRHEWINELGHDIYGENLSRTAPGGLWLLGEEGVAGIAFHARRAHRGTSEEVRRLFPEAEVIDFP
jgi:hypothetical protein